MSLVTPLWNPGPRDLRVFGAGQLLFTLVVLTVSYGRGWNITLWPWIVSFSASVALLGLLFPSSIRPIYLAWTIATFPIGWTMSHIVVGIVYFGVVTPIGLILTAIGHDPLNRRFPAVSQSEWHQRPVTRPKPDYFRQF